MEKIFQQTLTHNLHSFTNLLHLRLKSLFPPMIQLHSLPRVKTRPVLVLFLNLFKALTPIKMLGTFSTSPTRRQRGQSQPFSV